MFSYYTLGEKMNLEIVDDKYIFFTNDVLYLSDLNEEKISSFIKEIFVSMSEVYDIDLVGYYKVDIFIDEKIGSYIEICKIDEYISRNKKIDTKINIEYRNFYLKTKDLSVIYKNYPIYRNSNYYYISTKDVDNILDIIEDCELEYKNINLKPILR